MTFPLQREFNKEIRHYYDYTDLTDLNDIFDFIKFHLNNMLPLPDDIKTITLVQDSVDSFLIEYEQKHQKHIVCPYCHASLILNYDFNEITKNLTISVNCSKSCGGIIR